MILFLDTETTGLQSGDRICAIGFVIDAMTQYDLIHPLKKIPPVASSIHHITNEMVADAPIFNVSQSYHKFQECNRCETILVAHNAPFHLAMLEKEGIIWQGKVIDTLKCSKALMEDLEGYSLQFLRYETRLYRHEKDYFEAYGVSVIPHHPLSDALHIKMLYDYLLDLATKQQLITLSNQRLLLTRLPFGKYAKKRLETIALKDPRYLQWMLESLVDMDEDLRYSIEYYLRRL